MKETHIKNNHINYVEFKANYKPDYVPYLGAIKARLIEAGEKILRDVFESSGGRRFHFIDPSENELAIWSDK